MASGTGITVGLPNGAEITSRTSGIIPITTGEDELPITAHVFDDDQLDRTIISLADFCNRGCTATFTATSALITHGTKTIIKSSKAPEQKLWPIDLDKLKDIPESEAHVAISHNFNADYVNFWHACLGSPPVSTLIRALRAGYLQSLPRLTARMVSDNPPQSLATAQGHLDLVRQQHRQHLSINNHDEVIDDGSENNMGTTGQAYIVAEILNISDIVHSDLTGRFPVSSRTGNNYILVSVYKIISMLLLWHQDQVKIMSMHLIEHMNILIN
jgi:hypothetical protein